MKSDPHGTDIRVRCQKVPGNHHHHHHHHHLLLLLLLPVVFIFILFVLESQCLMSLRNCIRLGLVRAMLMCADILLLDEPTG